MSAFTRFYLKTAVVAVICLGLLGAAIPALVSAPDTASVLLGIGLLILMPVYALFMVHRFKITADAEAMRDNIVKEIEKHNEKVKAKLASKAPLLALLMVAPFFGGCSYNSVPAGNVLVVVNKYGTDKGVDVEVRGPGRYWLGWNQEGHLFPTFVQSPKWTSDGYKDQGFMCSTKEGLAIGADIGAQYEFVPEKIPVIFAKYRRGADELSDTVIRQLVSDALVAECSRITVEAAYGEGRDLLLRAVQARVVATLEPIGVRILSLNWLGRPRLPDEVIASITAKITATQKALTRENEVQETIAQANKDREKAKGEADAILTRARAEAEANKLVSQSLTPELVKYRALDRWNGELPRINGAGAVPFVDVSGEAKKQ